LSEDEKQENAGEEEEFENFLPIEGVVRRSSVSRATMSRVKSKGSIHELCWVLHTESMSLGNESQVRTWRHIRTYMYI
jgi:hypothetical protein